MVDFGHFLWELSQEINQKQARFPLFKYFITIHRSNQPLITHLCFLK